MLANLLIGLREGLEAALIIGILGAYLIKINRRDVLPKMWMGVGLAALLSTIVGVILGVGVATLDDRSEEIMAGTLSFLAVGLVTWMIFWMAKTARNLKSHLESDVENSLAGNGWGIMFVAFLAVGREGVETALFIWAAANATGERILPVLGAFIGLGIAAVLGWLIFKGMLRLNLKKFFAWSGAFLIIVAAGILSYGIHEFQEAGILPGDADKAFNVSAVIAPDTWYAVLLRGTIGFTPEMAWGQIIGWALYVGITLTVFLRQMNAKTPAK